MKKIKRLSVLFLLSLLAPGYAQATTNSNEMEKTSITEVSVINAISETSSFSLLESAQKKHYSLFVGYSGNFKDSSREQEKNNKYNHIFEVGAAYSQQFQNRLGYSVYGGSDFLINTKNVLVGPKVGFNFNYSLVMIGNEMILYTDGHFSKLFYRPYVGIGVGPLKVTAGYNVGLANKGTFKEVNSFNVGVTVPLFWGE